MSRVYDAKQHALRAHPEDREVIERVWQQLEEASTREDEIAILTELLSPVLPDEVENLCRELNWFRGCDDWELDEFLVEINKDREKAVDLIKRLQAQVTELNDYNKNMVENYQSEIDSLQARVSELLTYCEKLDDHEAELQGKIEQRDAAIRDLLNKYDALDVADFCDYHPEHRALIESIVEGE